MKIWETDILEMVSTGGDKRPHRVASVYSMLYRPAILILPKFFLFLLSLGTKAMHRRKREVGKESTTKEEKSHTF